MNEGMMDGQMDGGTEGLRWEGRGDEEMTGLWMF